MIAGLLCGDADAAEGTVCPPPGATWLSIALVGAGFDAPLRDSVIGQLGADLRARQLVLCDAEADPSSSPALARIALVLSADFALSIDVRDAVTDKRMTRELPLDGVPRDALALSITLAAEELLRASWIEAAFAPLPRPGAAVTPRPLPPAVQALNAEEIARMTRDARAGADAHPMAGQIAVLGAFERVTGAGAVRGQTDLGADLRFAWGGRLALKVRAGVREAADVASTHGTIRTRELVVGVGVAYGVVPRSFPWGAEIGTRADIVDVQFSGLDATGAQAASGSALGAVVSGTLGGWRRFANGPWRIVAETSLGGALHAVSAKDATASATGVSGLSIGAALGVAVTLPN